MISDSLCSWQRLEGCADLAGGVCGCPEPAIWARPQPLGVYPGTSLTLLGTENPRTILLAGEESGWKCLQAEKKALRVRRKIPQNPQSGAPFRKEAILSRGIGWALSPSLWRTPGKDRSGHPQTPPGPPPGGDCHKLGGLAPQDVPPDPRKGRRPVSLEEVTLTGRGASLTMPAAPEGGAALSR